MPVSGRHSQTTTILHLIIPIAILLLAGLAVLYSIKPDDAPRQAALAGIGIIMALGVYQIRWQFYLKYPWFWYLISIISLVATLLIGTASRGSTRWITLFNQPIQMSEFSKISLILFLASYAGTKVIHTGKQTAILMGLMIIPALLIFLQPDLGTALLIIGLSGTTIIFSGTPFKKFVGWIVIAAAISPLLLGLLKPYQLDRLESFLNPTQDPQGSGYNVLQSTIAVGSGQITGRGLGQGTQSHLKFLPERHTDFIFASLVEELGFLGGTVVIFTYGWLIFAAIHFAKKNESQAGSLVILLYATFIAAQVGINIGMNMGLFPVTGITLPLVSYGGSSLISTLIFTGIVIQLTKSGQAFKKTALPFASLRGS
jgi:rod shape determining protein RodA